jgi:hypothetical protein
MFTLLIALSFSFAFAAPGDIVTFIGNGTAAYSGKLLHRSCKQEKMYL